MKLVVPQGVWRGVWRRGLCPLARTLRFFTSKQRVVIVPGAIIYSFHYEQIWLLLLPLFKSMASRTLQCYNQKVRYQSISLWLNWGKIFNLNEFIPHTKLNSYWNNLKPAAYSLQFGNCGLVACSRKHSITQPSYGPLLTYNRTNMGYKIWGKYQDSEGM